MVLSLPRVLAAPVLAARAPALVLSSSRELQDLEIPAHLGPVHLLAHTEVNHQPRKQENFLECTPSMLVDSTKDILSVKHFDIFMN